MHLRYLREQLKKQADYGFIMADLCERVSEVGDVFELIKYCVEYLIFYQDIEEE